MKILINRHASQYEDPLNATGGSQFFANGLLNEISKNPKHSHTAIFFQHTHSDPKKFLYKIVKKGKNRIVIVNAFFETREIYKFAQGKPNRVEKFFSNLCALIAELKCDSFVLNQFSALAYMLMRAVDANHIPIVSIHHGLWFKEVEKLNIIKSSTKIRFNMEAEITQLAQKTIFVSKFSLREYEKKLGKVPKAKVEVINGPYNPAFLNKQPPAVNKFPGLKIGMVARWDMVKNHQFYLRLAKFAKLKKLGWNFFTITKFGSYSYLDELKKEYEDNITIIPTLDEFKLKKFFQNIDVVLVPSFFETFSLVVTEAILQNRPTLISNQVGWKDGLKELGLSSWITSFDDPAKVIKKINAVARKPIPVNIINEVKKQNHPDHIFKQYLDVIESLKTTR